jgi:hypothetical protein
MILKYIKILFKNKNVVNVQFGIVVNVYVIAVVNVVLKLDFKYMIQLEIKLED